MISDYDNMSVTLQWEPPADDGGRPILGYVIEMKDKFAPDWLEVTNSVAGLYKALIKLFARHRLVHSYTHRRYSG